MNFESGDTIKAAVPTKQVGELTATAKRILNAIEEVETLLEPRSNTTLDDIKREFKTVSKEARAVVEAIVKLNGSLLKQAPEFGGPEFSDYAIELERLAVSSSHDTPADRISDLANYMSGRG